MNTPDDAEHKVLLREFTPFDPDSGPTYADVERAIEKYILSRLPSPAVNTADAVMEEREACAKLCEDLNASWQSLPPRAVVDRPDVFVCARAIRARGTAVEKAEPTAYRSGTIDKTYTTGTAHEIATITLPDNDTQTVIRATPAEEAGKDAEAKLASALTCIHTHFTEYPGSILSGYLHCACSHITDALAWMKRTNRAIIKP